MNEQELQQAFIQFLAQKTGAKSQQELEAAIQQLGEEGLKQAYAEFMQLMQQQQVQAAKFGAKLNYIKSLRGQCPDGYEAKFLKKGGTVCKECVKKQQEVENTPSNAIDAFKCGRKMKKAKEGVKVTGHNGLKGTETHSIDLKNNRISSSTREWEDGTQSQRVSNPWGGFTYYGRDGRQYDSTIPQEKARADSLKRVDWRQAPKPRLKK